MKRIDLRRSHRALIAALWFLLLPPLAQAATEPLPTGPAAPTVAEVEFYTRPLVKARLRIPDSLQGFLVTTIKPEVGDASRFEVEVQFRAKTPFGGVTEHTARFRMKQTSRKNLWIVIAE